MPEPLLGATVEVDAFIGGHGPLPARERLEVHDPGRTRELVGTIGVAGAEDVDSVVRIARAAQTAWAATPVEERAAALVRAAELLEDVEPELAALLTRENGAILAVSGNEFLAAARILRFTAAHARALLAEPLRRESGGDVATIRRTPFGVVGAIVPWNAPIVLAAQKVAPALAAGNAVVVKPSPFAPLTVTILLERIAALLPAGVLSVVHGDGATGTALVEHPLVRMVSFTGGGATAKAIARAAAATLTRTHFELGGNDPAIVLDDADVPSAAATIVDHALRRSGQVCYAIKRVYVPRSHLAAFTDAAVAQLDAVRVGHGLLPGSTLGPVNNRGQYERIAGMRARLEAAGRRVVEGGERVDEGSWDEGHYLLPAIVPDAPADDEIVVEEQFGPLLPIVAYDRLEDAVALANGTEYGLAASVWSADVERATRVAERIESGLAFVNWHQMTALAQEHVPFGGVKQSGIGWENSPAGLAEYLEFHTVHAPRAA